MDNYVVTISRQFASFGRSIAKKMSETLGIEFYDRDIVEATAKRMGQPVPVISNEEENSASIYFRRKYPLGIGFSNMQDEIFNVQANIIRDFAKKDPCIIVGRCANSVLRNYAQCLNVFVYAPYACRLNNCTEALQMNPGDARKMIRDVDKARENYRRRYCPEFQDPFDGYDIMVDSSRFGIDRTAEILVRIVESGLRKQK